MTSRREHLSRVLERVKTEPGLARNTIVLLSLLAIAAVVGGVVLAHQRFVAPWANRQVVYAQFEATPGISPGNGQEVRIAGVIVGDIVAADVGPDGKARLTLSIERGHHLYQNARLVLRPKSPLNEMFVTIDPGGPPAREVPDGYQYPLTNTVRPVQVDEVLDHLDDNARAALTALLAESDVALTHAQVMLPGGLDATRAVSNDLRPVAEQLAVRKEKLRQLTTALAQVSKAVGGDDQRVQRLAAGLQTTLHAFGTHQPQVEQTLATLPGLLDNLKRSTDAVGDLSDQLDPTLRHLREASDAFPEALERFRGTADRLDDVVDAARPFLDAARPVVRDLRPFADNLRDALPALHGATRELDPVTRALLPYLPDVAAFTVQTRSIVSLTDANEGILRGLLQVSPDSAPALLGPNNGIRPLPAPAVPAPPGGGSAPALGGPALAPAFGAAPSTPRSGS
jgi:phospholipid/cholesterol/gamma-HCH transport system substrate-binding protein